MGTVCFVLFTALGSGLRSQAALQIENAALRHQLAVLQRQARGRPRLRPVDRLFWTWLCHLWPGWRHALVIVKPDTVLRWRRRGFRLYWRWKSRPRGPGRPRIPRAVQELIRQMCRANPTWGAPRIHGELLKLGITIAEATVGCLRRSLLIGQLHPYNRGGHEESHPPVHLSHEPDRWDGVRYLRV